MKNLIVAIAFVLSGCSGVNLTYYLTPGEVVEAVKIVAASNKKLLEDIGTLGESVLQIRQEVMFMAQMGLIEEKDFLKIRSHVLAADYYASKAWTSALEKNKDAQMLYQMGADELKRAIDAIVSSVDKKNSI